MLRNKFKYILSFFIPFLIGCNSYPDMPEGVVEKFIEQLSTGECEEAKEMCYGNAIDVIEMSVESGCEPYTIAIDSLDCEIRDTSCICAIYYNREYNHEMLEGLIMYYGLILVEGKWKVNDISKDAGPWSWVDYGANWFYNTSNLDEESDEMRYENPVETIDLIFSNYIKYDKSIESEDDREVITVCLKQLGSKLTVEELTIILNVWMYYDPIDFPRKELTESIFKKNIGNSKIAIEERINQKLDWENENTGSYSELQKLLEKLN